MIGYRNIFGGGMIVAAVLLLSGCTTTSSVRANGESKTDVQDAVSAVAGAVRGKPLSEEEQKNLERQIRGDKEAQSAIEAISGSVSGETADVKFCPVTGKRYASYMELCPVHHVPLETVDP